jgi:hypothetical protein
MHASQPPFAVYYFSYRESRSSFIGHAEPLGQEDQFLRTLVSAAVIFLAFDVAVRIGIIY